MNHIRKDLLLFLEKREKSEYLTAACAFLTVKRNMGMIEQFSCSVKEDILTIKTESHIKSFDMNNLKNEAVLVCVIES